MRNFDPSHDMDAVARRRDRLMGWDQPIEVLEAKWARIDNECRSAADRERSYNMLYVTLRMDGVEEDAALDTVFAVKEKDFTARNGSPPSRAAFELEACNNEGLYTLAELHEEYKGD